MKHFLLGVLFLFGTTQVFADHESGHSLRKNNVEDIRLKAIVDKDAMLDMALIYFNGEGVEKNKETAIEWLKQAADNGQPRALSILGNYYDKGFEDLVPADKEMAKLTYDKACELNVGYACYRIGKIYEKNNSLAVAKNYYIKAHELKDVDGAIALAMVFKQEVLHVSTEELQELRVTDPEKFLEYQAKIDDMYNMLKDAANKDPMAKYELAMLYNENKIWERDKNGNFIKPKKEQVRNLLEEAKYSVPEAALELEKLNKESDL